ncbi:hypothetical protein QAD02_006836 [Eretmocerus hayati]|uniref:Uncharacterized protein n=1 Tax=Eretmocerus hayati TaxID=131215 RepID=A0ACC2N2A0_9HYME|nr:hypothetical protein QAD02_006836 [Eretmocerus hayati]
MWGIVGLPAIFVATLILDHYDIGNGTNYEFVLFHTDYIVFEQENHANLVWVHLIIAYGMELAVFAAFVSMFVIYVKQICGLLVIVGHRLKNHIKSYADVHELSNNLQRDAQQSGLNEVVILHDQVLQYD